MDGHTTQILTNQITENLFATIDGSGNQFVLLEKIINHRTTAEAPPKEDAYFNTHTRRKTWRRTTKGWDLLFQWKDGSNDWIELKDVKESNPIEVAQYAPNKKLLDEPAFAWWINTIMKQNKRLIKKVKSKYWMTKHKFGVRIPKTASEALSLDSSNGNTLWQYAIQKKMINVRI